MKTTWRTLLVFLCLLATIDAAEPARTAPLHSGTNQDPNSWDLPLYLHLIAPRYYTDPPTPARRIVSTRIWLSKEFAVTVEDAPEATLAGKIDRVDGKSVPKELWGTFRSSKNWCDRSLELDEPARPTRVMFSSIVWSTVFVLSTNSDCRALLKKIDPELP